MEIDLHKILRERMPRNVGRWIPGFMISALERLIHQKELNEMLRVGHPAEGSEFARRILEHLEVTIEVEGFDILPEGRYMFASNHPLGGLDGIALISLLGGRYGDDNVRFLVNDMLMNIGPLSCVFLPVNKFGKQGREAAKVISEALASDRQILQFPAGLVSRLHDDGSIADLEWQKSFVTKSIEHKRDIVPVRFEGLNRRRFYRIARLRKRSGIKINLEQVLLPGEVFASRGKRFRIVFGTPISWEILKDSGKDARTMAAEIRSLVCGGPHVEPAPFELSC